MAIKNIKLTTSSSANQYAYADATTYFSNTLSSSAVLTQPFTFIVGGTSNMQLTYTAPVNSASSISGKQVLQTVQIQGSYEDYLIQRAGAKITLTNEMTGQTIVFNLLAPGKGGMLGYNVQFLDGSLAVVASRNKAGTVAYSIREGGDDTSLWGTLVKNGIGTAKFDLGNLDENKINRDVNTSDIVNWDNIFTINEAMDLGADNLPSPYIIEPVNAVAILGTVSVANEIAGQATAQELVDGAQNASRITLTVDYSLRDSLQNIADNADIVADANAYAITDGVISLGSNLTVTGAQIGIANATALKAGATNGASYVLDPAYTLNDSLANLSASGAATVLAGASSYSLNNAAGDLGMVTPEEAAIIAGATDASDYTWTVYGETFTMDQAMVLGIDGLPDPYRLSDAVANLGTVSVATEESNEATAQIILDDAQNGASFTLSVTYNLRDTLQNISDNADVVAGANSYAITNATIDLGTGLSVATTQEGITSATALKVGATNGASYVLAPVYTLNDTLANLSASSAASVLAGAGSYALSNTPGNLGTVTKAQAAIIAGASDASEYSYDVYPDVFALTTGVDAPGTGAFTVNSPEGNSNIYGTFNSVSATFTPGDNIVATGAGNTLYLTDLGTGSTGNVSLVNAKVSGVEALEVTSSEALSFNVTSGTQGWTGLTDATFYSTGGAAITTAATTDVIIQDTAVGKGEISVDGSNNVTITALGLSGGDITVGKTTEVSGVVSIAATSTEGGSDITVNSEEAVTITSNAVFTGNGTLGAITVASAGQSVTVTQTASNAVNKTTTLGTVTVTGTGSLEEVTVTNAAKATASGTKAGVNTNSVNIVDVNGGSASTLNGTITSVTVANFTTLGISDNALTTLNVTGGSGNIIIDNSSSLASVTNKTLALGINGQTAGVLDDADIYTTLNVTTSSTNSTLANITFGALTALNVDGTNALTLTSTAGMSALKAVTVSGAAGVTADFSGATVTNVDTSASTGAVKVTIDASKASFTGGSGTTTVTLAATTPSKAITLGNGVGTVDITAITGTPTGAITGGSGTSDTLKMTAASAATASADSKFAGIVSGFENLTLTGATNQTIDLSVLGSFQNVSTSGGNGLTLNNFVSGGTMTLTGAGTAYTLANSAWTAGSDTVNLVLTDGSGAGVAFASTGITAANAEIVNIAVADTQATPLGSFNDTVTWLGNSVKTIDVSGNAGLTLTASSTALTTVDASDITLGGFTWTSGALAGAATVLGSESGTNTVTLSAATKAVNYTGGTGADTVTINNAQNNVASLGDGNNSFTGGKGDNTITAGTGNDTATVTAGNNIVNLGDGANTFTATDGNNTYTGGSGVDTVTVGSGENTITTGAGNDIVNVGGTSNGINTVDFGTGTDRLNVTGKQSAAGNYTAVTGFDAGDIVDFATANGTQAATTLGSAITLGGAAGWTDYLNAGCAADGTATSVAKWFVYGGDTYITLDNGAAGTFTAGIDQVVQLTGVYDLSTSTIGGAATHALITLV